MALEEIKLSKEELSRYSRHLIIPEFGMEGQKKLKGAKVLVIGTGGLGSPVLLYLAAAGVGTIGIVDFDVVDDSNLQRQVLFTVADIGKPKHAHGDGGITGAAEDSVDDEEEHDHHIAGYHDFSIWKTHIDNSM
mgnify:CR=1 FL=1